MPQAKTTTPSKLRIWKKFGTKHHGRNVEPSDPSPQKATSQTGLLERLDRLQSLQEHLANHLNGNFSGKDKLIQEQLDQVNCFVEEVRVLLDEQTRIVHQAHSACDSLRDAIGSDQPNQGNQKGTSNNR